MIEPEDLAGILSPMDSERFLAQDYGQQFVHVKGAPDKFSGLLPWPVLNGILEQHRLEPPRLRLTREGSPVPPERYITYITNRRRSGQAIARIESAELTRELREGATLVLDNVDELHPPIRRLAESLERVFRVRVQVNSYAGWRTSHGFDLHWDDHDVFILQVAGRKHWKVYGVTRPYPLPRDVEAAVAPTEVLWEGLLDSGDLLYMPRGWWHVATPLNEPTLHLTVGVNNPTGADFLAWFSDRLRASEIVRQDIPHLGGPDAVRDYASRLRAAIADTWRPELVEEFLRDLDARSRPRPSFALPWGAMEAVLPPDGWRVRWSIARPARVEDAGEEIAVVAKGRRWKFAAEARCAIEKLLSGQECSAADFDCAGISAEDLRAFIQDLAANGLVAVR